MSSLNVTEYQGAMAQAGTIVPVPQERAEARGNVSFSSSASRTLGPGTKLIRIVQPTSACYYKVGAGTQTATASDTFLPTATVEYVGVNPGDTLAVYDGSS